MLIQNIKGTSGRIPDKYKTWKEFFKAETGENPKHDVGGHVKKAKSEDNSWYIADITHEQNMKIGPYEYSGKLAKLHT
jgi:hypothetical protein